MKYDTAVIGAGLAGLHTAYLLASHGLRVVLIDRKESIAEMIQTTGIFVRKTWEDFPLPNEQLGRPIRDVFLYSPAGRALHLAADHDEFRIGRMEWIYLCMLDQCTRAGVRWMPATDLVARHGGGLVLSRRGRRETILARYVVGADGARSRVAELFGLERNGEFLVGVEEIVETAERPPALHCFLDPRLAPGYLAWLATDGFEAHVGVAGYADRFNPAAALATFRQRVAPDRRTLQRRGGLIPVNGILRRIANRQALLVGDAAGAVSPLTAGGLDGALRLSALAAEVIVAYLDRNDPSVLQAYDGARFRTRFLARRWMRRMLRAASHPILMELVMAALATTPLKAVARHVFFSRGSFPEIPPAHLMLARNHSANAG